MNRANMRSDITGITPGLPINRRCIRHGFASGGVPRQVVDPQGWDKRGTFALWNRIDCYKTGEDEILHRGEDHQWHC